MAADTLAGPSGVVQPAIVGHSTGGAIGLCLAATHPERVQRLVLSATWTHADGYFRRLFEARRELLERGAGELYQRLSTLMLLRRSGSYNERLGCDEHRRPARWYLVAGSMLLRRRADWARKSLPHAVIAAQDAVTPAYFSRSLAQLVRAFDVVERRA
jgi:aminoacrylate hydrolase